MHNYPDAAIKYYSLSLSRVLFVSCGLVFRLQQAVNSVEIYSIDSRCSIHIF